jgi:UDP-N-acetylmuramate dehydrogenase
MSVIQENINLAPLTTFQIGGPATYFTKARSESSINRAISWAKEKNCPFIILGGASNVLISDEGFHGLVINLRGDLWSVSGHSVSAWAGSNLLRAIEACNTLNLGGWEKLSGIPGSIGGAVRGNAGAFGCEIKDFVTSVRAINSKNGESRDFTNIECDFSYRHSYFKDHPEWIITRVILELQEIEKSKGLECIQNTIEERERRHLQNVRAAGSFFMNPYAPPSVIVQFEKEKNVTSREGRVPAGWLIEKAGMKGARVGDAEASLQHPNYLINSGSATAVDVLKLATEIQRKVKAQFDIALKPEAAIVMNV